MTDFLSGKFQLTAVLLLIAVSAIPYINAISNDFVYDDIAYVAENGELKDTSNFIVFLQRPRGVKYITHLIEYQIWGLRPSFYHLANILLHALCTVSLFILIGKITGSRLISLMTGLLFAAHPIHSESVAFISGRTDLLAMLFFMWSFIFYLKRNGSSWFYFLSLVSFTLALLSKEGAVVSFPFMIIIHDIFFSKRGSPGFRRNSVYYIPYGLITIAFLLYVRFMLSVHPSSPEPGIAGLFMHVPFPAHAYTAFKAFLIYMGMLLFPLNLNIEHILPVSHSFFEMKVIAASAAMALFLIVASRTYHLSRVFSFGMAWFFITLLPLLNLFFPVTPYFVAERYLYLPSAGFCLITAIVFDRFIDVRNASANLLHKKAAVVLLLTVLFFYSAIAINRNFDWRSDYTLWSKTVKQSPESCKAHYNLGLAYAEKEMFENAVVEFKEAIKCSSSGESGFYNNLGNAYRGMGLLDEAASSYEEALRIDPYSTMIMSNLGNLYLTMGLLDKALTIYKRASELVPGNCRVHYDLGLIYLGRGLPDRAMREFQSCYPVKN